MPSLGDFNAYKSTGGGSGGGKGSGGRAVIIIAVILLIFFIFDGASWDAIETLLAFALIAYWIFK